MLPSLQPLVQGPTQTPKGPGGGSGGSTIVEIPEVWPLLTAMLTATPVLLSHRDALLTSPLQEKQCSTKWFIGLQSPHKPASKDTISRWIKWTLAAAGIDTSASTAHSTRGASTPSAKQRHTPIHVILQAAGWSTESTFTKFYCKRVDPSRKSNMGLFVSLLNV